MTDAEIKDLMNDRDDFFNAVRKGTLIEALTGRFKPGRLAYMHTVELDDGSKVVFKFIDTVKYIRDAKGRRIHGRDSFLSYLEVFAIPAGQKPSNRMYDIKQVVIGVPREEFEAKHKANLLKLVEFAKPYGIDLADSGAWARIYNENYKKTAAAG